MTLSTTVGMMATAVVRRGLCEGACFVFPLAESRSCVSAFTLVFASFVQAGATRRQRWGFHRILAALGRLPAYRIYHAT